MNRRGFLGFLAAIGIVKLEGTKIPKESIEEAKEDYEEEYTGEYRIEPVERRPLNPNEELLYITQFGFIDVYTLDGILIPHQSNRWVCDGDTVSYDKTKCKIVFRRCNNHRL